MTPQGAPPDNPGFIHPEKCVESACDGGLKDTIHHFTSFVP